LETLVLVDRFNQRVHLALLAKRHGEEQEERREARALGGGSSGGGRSGGGKVVLGERQSGRRWWLEGKIRGQGRQGQAGSRAFKGEGNRGGGGGSNSSSNGDVDVFANVTLDVALSSVVQADKRRGHAIGKAGLVKPNMNVGDMVRVRVQRGERTTGGG